ncbi:MAG: bax protein, partial [Gammaproteobacteria bacterium]
MSALYRSLRLFVPLFAFITWGVIHSPEKVEERVEWVEVDITIPGLPPLPDWATDALPDFARFQDTTEKKIAFFNFLYPRIVLANSRILMERNYLLELQRTANADGLHISQLKWLQAQAERLRATGEPGS